MENDKNVYLIFKLNCERLSDCHQPGAVMGPCTRKISQAVLNLWSSAGKEVEAQQESSELAQLQN